MIMYWSMMNGYRWDDSGKFSEKNDKVDSDYENEANQIIDITNKPIIIRVKQMYCIEMLISYNHLQSFDLNYFLKILLKMNCQK